MVDPETNLAGSVYSRRRPSHTEGVPTVVATCWAEGRQRKGRNVNDKWHRFKSAKSRTPQAFICLMVEDSSAALETRLNWRDTCSFSKLRRWLTRVVRGATVRSGHHGVLGFSSVQRLKSSIFLRPLIHFAPYRNAALLDDRDDWIEESDKNRGNSVVAGNPSCMTRLFAQDIHPCDRAKSVQRDVGG